MFNSRGNFQYPGSFSRSSRGNRDNQFFQIIRNFCPVLFQSILLLKRNWKLCTYYWRLALTPRGFLSFLEISEGKYFSALAKTYLYTESPSGELGPLEISWRGRQTTFFHGKHFYVSNPMCNIHSSNHGCHLYKWY